MRSSKLILCLSAVAFLLPLKLCGAAAERWNAVCTGEGYKSWKTDFFDFYYPEKCQGLFEEEKVVVSSTNGEKEEIKKRVNVLKETDTFQYYKFHYVRFDLI